MVSPYGASATKVLAETTPSSGDQRWPNAELIAAAPDIAHAYLEQTELLTEITRERDELLGRYGIDPHQDTDADS